MGGKSEKADCKDWSIPKTKAFIEKIYDRVKKGQLQGSTFKQKIWQEINNELKDKIGENYGIDRLKGKFNRLRTQHREFSTLLSRTGVTWDSGSNKVNAPDEVWEDLYRQGRFYKQFKKHGFEHDYEILGEIFNPSTATGKLRQPSTQEPPTSDQEREMEREFLSKGVHFDLDSADVDEDYMQELDKKRKACSSSSERPRKDAKSSRMDEFKACFNSWNESMAARKEASLAKAERYRKEASKATSPVTDPFSSDASVDLLESLEGVSDAIYLTALEKFTNVDWRRMFIKMSSSRRMVWLTSLK